LKVLLPPEPRTLHQVKKKTCDGVGSTRLTAVKQAGNVARKREKNILIT